MKLKKGFTLIELLVVIAIIALLSTLAVVALSSARTKARDAKRLSDMKQISTALELYFTDNNTYPVQGPVTLGSASYKALCGTALFAAACSGTPYLALVPANPLPGGADYSYTGTATAYTITFTLEGTSGGFNLGAMQQSEKGMTHL